ncbi:MAG: hypothetical protein JNK38_01245 [Acidobacteria bacterium]|nr:hypothetical protein [Acidobacteriota bacterium]
MPQFAEPTITTESIATRDAFLAECRSFLGVKWQHQGRSEQGIDCVGLLIVPAIRLQILQPNQDVTNYPRQPDGEQLSALLHQHCRRLLDWKTAQIADILAIKFADQPQHVAIVTAPYHSQWGFHVIHAFGNSEMGGSVIEHRLDDVWLKSHRARIHAAFSIKGVT